MNILVIFQCVIFVFLSLVHINWARGGSWGFDNAIPTDEDGNKVMSPSKRDSLIVGIGLFLFAMFYLVKIRVIVMDLPNIVLNSVGWVISVIFLLRAMGDFKYVGFFKRIKDTNFGQQDSMYYAPLCLIIGINGVLIETIL